MRLVSNFFIAASILLTTFSPIHANAAGYYQVQAKTKLSAATEYTLNYPKVRKGKLLEIKFVSCQILSEINKNSIYSLILKIKDTNLPEIYFPIMQVVATPNNKTHYVSDINFNTTYFVPEGGSPQIVAKSTDASGTRQLNCTIVGTFN